MEFVLVMFFCFDICFGRDAIHRVRRWIAGVGLPVLGGIYDGVDVGNLMWLDDADAIYRVPTGVMQGYFATGGWVVYGYFVIMG